MFRLISNNVSASKIAAFLNEKLHGEEFQICKPCSFIKLSENCVTYATNQKNTERIIKKVKKSKIKNLLVICPLEMKGKNLPFTAVFSLNPRLGFIKIIRRFFVREIPPKISSKAIIEKEAKIGSNVSIGSCSYVGQDVTIGDSTIIGKNVVINGKVNIGKHCLIKDNTTIGSEGFSFEYDEDDIPIHFPQMGKILIGNHVWIGSNSTIERPALDETIIEDHVKIDDLVHISHNCLIGEKTLIIAGSILSGGVKVGKKCWISPNSTILQKVSVGEHAVIGIGAVVTKDVPPNSVVAGNPARLIKKKT